MSGIKKILVSIAALFVLIGCLVIFYEGYRNKADGSFTAEIVDINQNVIQSKTVKYRNGDKMEDLLAANFDNVVMQDGFLMSIGTLTTAEDWSYFISIYVDDEMSMFGIHDLPYADYQKISFVETQYIYE